MINTLTSLRLFFALMVFGAHCYVVDSTFSTHFYKEGFVGVSFFFILSGFIIAYRIETFYSCAVPFAPFCSPDGLLFLFRQSFLEFGM